MSKKANYTAEQAEALANAYEAAESQDEREAIVLEFAEQFGKPAQSIRAKLVSMGIYVKKTYKTKTGNKPEAKSEIVADIASALGVNQETVESLEKANKAVLNLVRGTLARLPQD